MTLPPAVRRLITVRLIRSVGQGALAVDFALYARALGWSAPFLGSVLGIGLVTGAAVTAIIGPLSDRIGRKRFLIAYELVSIAAAVVATTVSSRWPLALAVIAAGYGRGLNGSPGLFGAIEQAWLGRMTARGALGRLYARNSAVGFLGTAAGSMLAALPTLWQRWLPGALAYRPLFALAGIAAAAALVLLAGTEDGAAAAPAPTEDRPERRREHGLLWRLAGLNALNGIGIGLSGPLLTWWLAARYGVGPALIGPALAATSLLAALSALTAGRLGRRFGAVRVVVAMRAAGLCVLVLLPFAPSYAAAMALYALRTVLNRGSAGSRQALAMGLVAPQRQGLAATISSISTQIPRAAGPGIAGLMFGAGALAAPFLLAALFQAAYLVLYPLLFAAHDPERPRDQAAT